VMTPAACRAAGVSLAAYARATIVPALAGTIPAVLFCAAIRLWAPPATTWMALIDAAAVGIVYLLAAGSAGLDRSTRQLYREQVTAACRLVLE